MNVCTVKLCEVAETSSGGTPLRGVTRYYNGHIPWVKSGELPDGLINKADECITQEGLDNSSSKLLPAGTLLIAMYGATVGKLGILGISAATNQAVCAITPNPDIDRDYLFYWLLKIRNALIGISFGGAQPNISQNVIRDIEVPLPPLDDQRRIAARLKAQLAEVETARRAAEIQLKEAGILVKRLQENIFLSLSQVKRSNLGDLLVGIEAGKSFQTLERLAGENELGVLKVSAVSWSQFNPNEAKAIHKDYMPHSSHRIRNGDILISRANTVELVGAVVRVDKDYPNRLLSDKTLRLLPDTTRIYADFLVHMLRSSAARTFIENNATGTSDSMRNISQKTISAIPIPLPKMEIQQDITRQLSYIEHESRKIEAALTTMMSDIDCLPPKLLQEVFKT